MKDSKHIIRALFKWVQLYYQTKNATLVYRHPRNCRRYPSQMAKAL